MRRQPRAGPCASVAGKPAVQPPCVLQSLPAQRAMHAPGRVSASPRPLGAGGGRQRGRPGLCQRAGPGHGAARLRPAGRRLDHGRQARAQHPRRPGEAPQPPPASLGSSAVEWHWGRAPGCRALQPSGSDPGRHARLAAAERALPQANLWTEYISDELTVEYMLLPRLCALAETLWSPKASRDWQVRHQAAAWAAHLLLRRADSP